MAAPLTNIPAEESLELEHEESSVLHEAETFDEAVDSNQDLHQASNVDAHVDQGGQENGDRAQPLPWTGVHPEAPAKIINRRKKKDPMTPTPK